MLPSLRKTNEKQFSVTQSKVYNPRELAQYNSKKEQPSRQSARNNPKTKVGGGFKLSAQQQPARFDSAKIYQTSNNYNSRTVVYPQKKSSTDIGQEIKLIEKKIKQCQKKIEQDKKRKMQEEREGQQNRYDKDFEQIIRRELQLQGYKQDQHKGFDYLTNPGGPPPEEEPTQELLPPQPEPQAIYSIADGVEKLERFYENSLKKKFERREAAHKACRRKTPKLFITQKTNALSKHGKPLNQDQHKFRVMTKQITPQQIYPVIPNFAVVKDNLSKNIVAYLGDYKPFIDKTKQKVQKEVNKEGEIVVQNSNKTITVST